MPLSLLMMSGAHAQNDIVRASIHSFKGSVRMYRNSRSTAIPIQRNISLEPENIIETDHNGKVIIALSDNSRITVLPDSKVVLKNFKAPYSARELLEILVGRVIVKIHHAPGKANPYSLSSPSASIAVRGTEFIVDVLLGGETLVFVRDGLVEVWSHNNPDKKRLVAPGGRVTVRPGGDISSAFPGPGSGLGGRTRFNWDMAEEYQRSVDSVAQNSNEIYPVFFSAFSDRHLDSLENPAYAVDFNSAEGRLVMLPSADKLSFSANTTQLNYSVSPHMTLFTPIPGSRFVVGGGVSGFGVRLENRSDYHGPAIDGISGHILLDEHFREVMKFNALNVSFVAAYSFGDHGKTGVGIGVEKLSGVGNFLNERRKAADGREDSTYGNMHARFARTRLTIGLTRRFSDNMRLGLYYRHSAHSSAQVGVHSMDQINPEINLRYSRFNESSTNISNLSSEIGARFRAALTRRLYYGGEGSYLYERINSRHDRHETLNAPNYEQYRYLARRARLGAGLGFALNSKTLLSFDFSGGIFNNDRPPQEPGNPHRVSFGALFSPGSLRNVRGKSLSFHAAAQTNLWRGLFLSASSLQTLRRDLFYQGVPNFIIASRNGEPTYVRNENYELIEAAQTNQYSNFGGGWRFKPNLTAEYVYSIDHDYGYKSHSFNIRYTFNLSITGEK